MILIEFLQENKLILSSKGVHAMGKAIKDVYPHMDMWITHDEDSEYLIRKILSIELPDGDCLRILQLTAKYTSLWAFA